MPSPVVKFKLNYTNRRILTKRPVKVDLYLDRADLSFPCEDCTVDYFCMEHCTHVFENADEFDITEEICQKCGWVKTEEWFIPEYKGFVDPRNHDIYSGKDYLKKKRYQLAGYKNIRDVDIRMNPWYKEECWNAINDCKNWKEIKKQLNNNGLTSRLYNIPMLFGNCVTIPDEIFALCTDMIYKHKIPMKFECFICKALACAGMEYQWVPLYWSDTVLKKNDELWKDVVRLTRKTHPWIKEIKLAKRRLQLQGQKLSNLVGKDEKTRTKRNDIRAYFHPASKT